MLKFSHHECDLWNTWPSDDSGLHYKSLHRVCEWISEDDFRTVNACSVTINTGTEEPLFNTVCSHTIGSEQRPYSTNWREIFAPLRTAWLGIRMFCEQNHLTTSAIWKLLFCVRSADSNVNVTDVLRGHFPRKQSLRDGPVLTRWVRSICLMMTSRFGSDLSLMVNFPWRVSSLNV